MKRLLQFALLIGISASNGAIAQATFNYTGSMQTWVVPAGITDITVECWGAQGGGDSVQLAPGGLGGYMKADITVTPGQTLNIYVGGQGNIGGAGGYNGGGAGFGSSSNFGGSGGGATDIRIGGTTLNDRVLVAGGGGGGDKNADPAGGGVGGGLTGGDGIFAYNGWNCTNLTMATGGTQSAGGLGGTSTSCAWDGSDGAFGVGGDSYQNYACGGGGGGWYGGGGSHNGSTGAGGSSYSIPAATNVSHQQGVQLGDGMVVIEFCSAIDTTLSVTAPMIQANQAGATYQWLDCDNNYAIINGETSQSYTPTATGNYAVEINLQGCLDTSNCVLIDFTGIEELNESDKELIKIIDLMGRETEYTPNTPLIYIYNDGTRERVMKIEK